MKKVSRTIIWGLLLASLAIGLPGHLAQAQTDDQPAASSAERVLRAGAAVIDITPTEFPVIVSGSFLERTAADVKDPLHARALVLDDGATRLAIVVVDTLLMPRDLIDKAKETAEQSTGIATDRILVAATHTHCAPSVVGALGTGVDEPYVKRLPDWIAQAIDEAAGNLAPARVSHQAL